MDPLQQLNDQLRQAAHAEQERQRTAERRQSPEERDAREQDDRVRRIVQEEVAKEIAKLAIKAGQNITSSGTGQNIMISATIPTPLDPNGLAQGVWTTVTDCDGNTMDVLARNFS